MRKRSRHCILRQAGVVIMGTLLGFGSPGGANLAPKQESRAGSLSTAAPPLTNHKPPSQNLTLRHTSVETDNDESRSIIIGERVPGVLLEDDDTDIYHFWGVAGETVGVEVNSETEDLDPVVTVFHESLAPMPISLAAIPFALPCSACPEPQNQLRGGPRALTKDDPSPGFRFAFSAGEVFAAVGEGKVKRFQPDGTLIETLDTGVASRETTGMAFDAANNFYVTLFQAGQIHSFDFNGTHRGAFGPGGYSQPESIAIDLNQNLYVGQAGASAIRKFDSQGNQLDSFTVEVGPRGTDWIDLAADQRTIYYTSEGKIIRRYDVLSKTQLPRFNPVDLPGSKAYALRILPDASVIVSDTESIHLLDPSGAIVRTYDAPTAREFFATNLDPDGRTFWSGDIQTGIVYRFDLASGDLVASWDAEPFTTLAGLSVFGEITAARVLNVTKSAAARVRGGGELIYTLNYSNSGLLNASNVAVRDVLPAGTSFIAASIGGGLQGSEVVWNLGTVAAGATGTLTLTVRVNVGSGSIVNTEYSISADDIPAVAGAPVTTLVGHPLIRHDDNSGPGNNALINVLHLGATGVYTVLVSSARAESRGGYELVVAPLDKDSNVAALRGPVSSTTRAEVFQTNDSQDRILAGAPTSRFLEFSPDGESLTLDGPITSSRRVEVYDTGEPSSLDVAAAPTSVFLEYAPDGESLAVSGPITSTDRVEIYNARSGRLVVAGAPTSTFLGFSPDGLTAAFEGPITSSRRVELYSTRTGDQVLAAAPTSRFLEFSPDGSLVAIMGPITSTERVEVYSTRSRDSLIFSGAPTSTWVVFSPDSESAAIQGPITSTMRSEVYNTRTGNRVFAGAPTSSFLTFSPDGDTASIVGPITSVTRVELYSTRSASEQIFAGAPTSEWIGFSPDGETAAIMGPITSTTRVEVVSTRTGNGVFNGAPTSTFLAFAPDGSTTAILGPITSTTRVELYSNREQSRRILAAAPESRFDGYSPDAESLALVGPITSTERVEIYSALDGRSLVAGAPTSNFAGFAPDGDSLVMLGPITSVSRVEVYSTISGSRAFAAAPTSTWIGFSWDGDFAALIGPITSTTRVEVWGTRQRDQVVMTGAPTSTFLGFTHDSDSTAIQGPITSTTRVEVYDNRNSGARRVASSPESQFLGFSLDGDNTAILGPITSVMRAEVWSNRQVIDPVTFVGAPTSRFLGFGFCRIRDSILANPIGPALDLPLIRSNRSEFTGLAFLNLGTRTRLTVNGYDDDGSPLDRSTRFETELEDSQQIARTSAEMLEFGSAGAEGWVQARVDTTSVVGFGLFGSADGNLLDGVDFSLSNRDPELLGDNNLRLPFQTAPPTGQGASLILTDVRYTADTVTEFHLANPTNQESEVEVQLFNSAGSRVDLLSRTLDAKEKLQGEIHQLFSGVNRPFFGYVIISGTTELAALALLVTDASLGALRAQPLRLEGSVASQLYSSQLATGQGLFFTLFSVVNPTSLAANLTFRAFSENGTESTAPANRTLPAGRQLRVDAGDLFGFNPANLEVGSVIIESDIQGLLGNVVFGDPSAAKNYLAVLPLDYTPGKFAAYAHIATVLGLFTGLSAQNPNPDPTDVVVEVFEADSTRVGRWTSTLRPFGRFSLTLPSIIPASSNMGGGYFTYSSSLPTSSFALFGYNDLRALSAISGLRFGTSTLPPPTNPVPVLNSLNPSSAAQGTSALTLEVRGQDFVAASVVRWNGSDRPTTFVDGRNLEAQIGDEDLAEAGQVEVTVFSPSPGGGTSDGRTFQVNASNPVPAITSIDPDSRAVGSPAFTLTVNGENFVPGSTVRWNGSNRSTTFISSAQLEAAIPASDIQSTGSATITVFNPTPGGGTSNAIEFDKLASGTGPAVTDVRASTVHPGLVVTSIDLNDADGDITAVDFEFFQGNQSELSLTASSPDDIDLTDFQCCNLAIWVSGFDGEADLLDRVEIEVRDAMGQSSGVFSAPLLTNLVVNPGAETGLGSADGSVVAIPGWDTLDNFTAVQYGVASFPSTAQGDRISGGSNFFSGGPNADFSDALQTIDISNQAVQIDAGNVEAVVNAFLASFGSSDDNATVFVDFFDEDFEFLDTLELGPRSGSNNDFFLHQGSITVPAGTRLIDVYLVAERVDGSYNDGFFDNIFFGLRNNGN